MGENTGINWCDATLTPVRGCTNISAGCKNCYARDVTARFSGPGLPYEGLAKFVSREIKIGATLTARPDGTIDQRSKFKTIRDSVWTGGVRWHPEQLLVAFQWKRGRRIFISSMSDVFHVDVTNEQIAAIFAMMAACPQHTFLVLTKRARRAREWFAWLDACERERHVRMDIEEDRRRADLESRGFKQHVARPPTWHSRVAWDFGSSAAPAELDVMRERPWQPWPLRNVWLGTSVEDQDAADERIPELLNTPATVRFISAEPLIGVVDLRRVRPDPMPIDALTGGLSVPGGEGHSQDPRISWIIGGCESGRSARPCEVEWLRALRDQCAATGANFWLKQAEASEAITAGAGSKSKKGLIDAPYLDGVQHLALPKEPDRG